MTQTLKSILLAAATSVVIMSCADMEVKRSDSYNYLRAVEADKAGNSTEARKYIDLELADNPQNGYALLLMAYMQYNDDEYGEALSYVNKALRFLPGADKEYLAFALYGRAQVYLELADTTKAMADLAKAIKKNPESTHALEERAQLYYEQGKYDKSDDDYRHLLETDEASYVAYMGLARNANKRGDYQEAIKRLDHVLKLYPDYGRALSFRAESYLGLMQYDEAVEDLIKALDLEDEKAGYLLVHLADDAVPLMRVKLKVQAQKESQNPSWPYALGRLCESRNLYAEAAQFYLLANELDADHFYLWHAADCYSELGDYAKAIELLGKALNLNPGSIGLMMDLANAYGNAGMLNECLAAWQHVIDDIPDYYGAYYRKGFFEDNYNLTEQAIEDYSMSITLEPSYAYAYLGRADMYKRQGKTELAKADYEKVIALDTIPNNESCAMYAYLYLDRKEEAINFMEEVIRQDSLDPGNYYDGACFYSRIGDKQKAISMLGKSLELGFARFAHIEHDDDLDPIRDTKEFKELIETYRRNPIEASETEEEYEEVITEVPFTKEAGTTKVQCQINGLPLHFIFDTGASDVSLSMVEANFMMKNEYITKNDIIGSRQYMDANGDISEGTVINLKSVNFGGLELNNVRASVVRNQRAPLLLGQSVLGRLGKVEIDNPGMKLVITQPVKKQYSE